MGVVSLRALWPSLFLMAACTHKDATGGDDISVDTTADDTAGEIDPLEAALGTPEHGVEIPDLDTLEWLLYGVFPYPNQIIMDFTLVDVASWNQESDPDCLTLDDDGLTTTVTADCVGDAETWVPSLSGHFVVSDLGADGPFVSDWEDVVLRDDHAQMTYTLLSGTGTFSQEATTVDGLDVDVVQEDRTWTEARPDAPGGTFTLHASGAYYGPGPIYSGCLTIADSDAIADGDACFADSETVDDDGAVSDRLLIAAAHRWELRSPSSTEDACFDVYEDGVFVSAECYGS